MDSHYTAKIGENNIGLGCFHSTNFGVERGKFCSANQLVNPSSLTPSFPEPKGAEGSGKSGVWAKVTLQPTWECEECPGVLNGQLRWLMVEWQTSDGQALGPV